MTKKNRQRCELLAQHAVDRLEVRLRRDAAEIIVDLRGDVEDLVRSKGIQVDEARQLLMYEFSSRVRELMIVSLREHMHDSFELMLENVDL